MICDYLDLFLLTKLWVFFIISPGPNSENCPIMPETSDFAKLLVLMLSQTCSYSYSIVNKTHDCLSSPKAMCKKASLFLLRSHIVLSSCMKNVCDNEPPESKRKLIANDREEWGLLTNERTGGWLLWVGRGINRNKLVVTPWEHIKYA